MFGGGLSDLQIMLGIMTLIMAHYSNNSLSVLKLSKDKYQLRWWSSFKRMGTYDAYSGPEGLSTFEETMQINQAIAHVFDEHLELPLPGSLVLLVCRRTG